MYKSGHGMSSKICMSCYVIQRRRNFKQKLVNMLGGRCEICGYSRSSWALEFHHYDRTTKKHNVISDGFTRAFSKIVEEAKKCVLLCSNCHREVEAGVTQVPEEVKKRFVTG